VADHLAVVAAPSFDHLALLRDVLDPESRYFPERHSPERHSPERHSPERHSPERLKNGNTHD